MNQFSADPFSNPNSLNGDSDLQKIDSGLTKLRLVFQPNQSKDEI